MYLRRVIVILVAASMLVTLSIPVTAQSSNWVTVTSVKDLTGNATLQPNQPLLAGHAYNVTMSVAVPFNQTTSRFQATLDGALQAHGSQFWYLDSPHYGGYQPANFTAGLHSVSFIQIEGTVILSAIFLVPANLTVQQAGPLTLHVPLQNYSVVTVTVLPNSKVGGVTTTVQDQTIQTYLTTYQTKSNLISSGQVDSTYAHLVNGVLNMSQILYGMGLADTATALLNVLTPSAFPAPPSGTTMDALFGAVVVLVVLAVALGVLALRARAKSEQAAAVASDVQKELATLEVTASKYDRELADRLKAQRDKLSEAS